MILDASGLYEECDAGTVTPEYLIADEDDLHIETSPIDYDNLQFEDFTAIWQRIEPVNNIAI